MSDAAVQLKVAGKTYQVVTSAAPDELHRLAAKVEEALLCVNGEGREPSAQSLILAAITLAHELEEERALRLAAEKGQRQLLEGVIAKVDRVLSDEVFGGVAKESLRKQRPAPKRGTRPEQLLMSELTSTTAMQGEASPGEAVPVVTKSGRRFDKSRSV